MVNFFVIGAPKCGTTSLHDWITQCSHIETAKRKELFFFDYQFELGFKWYHSHFNFKAIVGDFTPTYFYSLDALKRIYSYNPNAKIIVLLRNPVNRFVSHYNDLKNWTKNDKDIQLFSDTIIDRGRFNINFNLFENGRYSLHIRKLLSIFPSKNVKIVFFEELIKYPKTVLYDILTFIGIDDPIMSDIKLEVFNNAYKARSLYVNKLLGSEFLRDISSKSPNFLQNYFRKIYKSIRKFNSNKIEFNENEIDINYLKLCYKTEIYAMDKLFPTKVQKFWT